MNKQHTPGPWECISDIDGVFVTGPNRSEPAICDLVPRDADSFTREDDANGCLIAASPDLYAACERIVKWYETESQQVVSEIDEVRAAIAKAKGEKQ